MRKDIYEKLIADYQPESALQEYKILSVSEQGICYRAKVDLVRRAVVFQVDGDIVCGGLCCDKLILSVDPDSGSHWIGHFVELKGTDVDHAVQQLESTITNPMFQRTNLSKRYARIVARAFPSNRGDPQMERARIRFLKNYKCELKKMKSNQPDII